MRTLLLALALLCLAAQVPPEDQLGGQSTIAVNTGPPPAAPKMHLAVGLAAPLPSLTVPVGYQATAKWDAVTQDTSGGAIIGSVTYKMYNVKNGVQGYMGTTSSLTWKWAINVPQCNFVTAVVYVSGVAKESPPSNQVCIATQ